MCLFVFVCLFLFGCLIFILFCFQNKNKKEKSENIKTVYFVYIGTCVPWMAIETNFLNFVSLVA